MGISYHSHSCSKLALAFGLVTVLSAGCEAVAQSPASPTPPTAAAVVISTSTLPQGTAGTVYSASLTSSGGIQPYQWSVAAGSLPAGLNLDASGVIAGTPSVSGTANFRIQVQDAKQKGAAANLAITIGASGDSSAPKVSTSSLAGGTVGKLYSVSLAATGGRPPYQWSLTRGILPAGLLLNASSGAISGSPTVAGTSDFRVQVQDSKKQVASARLTLPISSAGATAVTITTNSLADGTVGGPYFASLAASGGTTPYQWSVIADSLPTGLYLGSAGTISGTPSSSGTAHFTVQIQDAKQKVASASLSLTIAPAGTATLTITTKALSSGTVGAAYSASLAASGGTTPYQWSVATGSLPTGLKLSNGSGAISGIPSTSGNFAFSAKVQDSTQQIASADLSISVAPSSGPSPLQVATTSLPSGSVGSAYSTLLTASGGTKPYQWSITMGSLPSGLTVNAATGAISGTPGTAANSQITVQATDASSPQKTASANFSIVISATGPPPGAVVVTTFGATGNGQTDDTKAINASIAILKAGQTLYFPCGIYAISNSLTTIRLDDATLEGATSLVGANCATLKLVGTASFTAINIQRGTLSSSETLVADTTANTFQVVTGGLSTIGITPGSYALISDQATASNGSGSPPISTQQMVKIIAVNGDTATIEGNFAHDYALVSPHPSNQGCCPYIQKVTDPLQGVRLVHLNLDGSGNTGSSAGALRLYYAVNSEIGFVTISNIAQNPNKSDAIIFDTGYQNNFHDITCIVCGNGTTSDGHSFDVRRQTLANFANISVTNTQAQYSFAFNLGNVNYSTSSNITIDGGGAKGRPFKLLRSNHNTFDEVTAKNGGDGKNGINITDISTYNTFNGCLALNNDGTGIKSFGNFNQHNTFNNCTSKFNTKGQFALGFDAFNNFADHFTTIVGGTFCCARGNSAIMTIDANDFSMSNASLSDDNHGAPSGLKITGDSHLIENNKFSGLPSGTDIIAEGVTNTTFAGNSTPDGTTPSGLANLFRAVRSFYASLFTTQSNRIR